MAEYNRKTAGKPASKSARTVGRSASGSTNGRPSVGRSSAGRSNFSKPFSANRPGLNGPDSRDSFGGASRGPRSFGGDRDARGPRSFGGDRDSRAPRSFGGDRDSRAPRSFGGDRDSRAPRSFGGDRDSRAPRSFSGDRDTRAPRSFGGDRDNRGPRSFSGDRDTRAPRSFGGDRDNRAPRSFGGDRDSRAPRSFGGDRDSRAPRSFGGNRDNRGPRSFGGDRDNRAPRSFGGDRDNRGPRSFGGDRDNRGPRSFGGDRDNRGPRSFGNQAGPQINREPSEDSKLTLKTGDTKTITASAPASAQAVAPQRELAEITLRTASGTIEIPASSTTAPSAPTTAPSGLSPRERRAYVKKETPARENLWGREGTRNAFDRPVGKRGPRREKPKGPAAPTMSSIGGTEPVRLNRFISAAGITSRRKADGLITQGKVTVNGSVIKELGVTVDPYKDHVTVNGETISLKSRNLYLLLNKPKDTITTTSDERDRKTVLDLVNTQERVYPVGRLDRNTTGVLLLTNDGELTNRLTHPSYEIPRQYHITLDKPLTMRDAKAIAEGGIDLGEGDITGAAELDLAEKDPRDVLLTIREGKNREVRRIFAALGYDVEKLDRVMFAGINHRGLGRGETRTLQPREVRYLRTLVGLSDEAGLLE